MALSVADADAYGRCWRASEQPGRLDKLRAEAQAGCQRSQQIAAQVIMAQSSCSQDQAFDTLRRASQRLNVPVRDLAAKIVDAGGRGALG